MREKRKRERKEQEGEREWRERESGERESERERERTTNHCSFIQSSEASQHWRFVWTWNSSPPLIVLKSFPPSAEETQEAYGGKTA